MSNDRPYEKDCMYCHKQITMSKETGKWLPYNKDNSAHDCRKQTTIIEEMATKQESPTNREIKIANVIKMIQNIIPELESLK